MVATLALSISITQFFMLLTAGVTVVYQLSFFFVAATFKFDKVTDFAGGSNFVVLGILTLTLGESLRGSGSITLRQYFSTILVLIWGVRLSGFLLYRICKTEEDKRFDGVREDLVKFALFWVAQMAWVWIVSLPVTYINSITDTNTSTTPADVAGWVLAILGLIIESIADQEKFNFRESRTKTSAFINTGTWRYSRHPNYYGELLFWWGIFISVSTSFSEGGSNDVGGDNYGYLTIFSPLFISLLLLGGSGLPIVEASANKKLANDSSYREYKKATPVLIMLPPGLYSLLPSWFKAAFCFEWYGEIEDPVTDTVPAALDETSSLGGALLTSRSGKKAAPV